MPRERKKKATLRRIDGLIEGGNDDTLLNKRHKNIYCGGASRYWPRSLVLSIAGREKKKVRTIGTELRRRMDGLVGAAETRTVVMQELFDKVHMGEDHTPTAVSFKL